MRKVGELPWEFWSFNTCEYRGRVFNFAPDDQGKLVVNEIFLGEGVEVKEIDTGVACRSRHTDLASCCLFDDKIFVVAGENEVADFFCAFVTIDPGELTRESIHIEEKRGLGSEDHWHLHSLVQLAKNKVWALFPGSNEIWTAELKGDMVVMTSHSDVLPMDYEFGGPPLRLSSRRFLAVGEGPISTGIIAVTPGEHFSFKEIGDLPREGRYYGATILVAGRFVVRFGGDDYATECTDDMWIFDLRTGKASPVANEGEMPPMTYWPFLTVKDDILYIVGGADTRLVHSISLQAISELIQDTDLQSIFQTALDLEIRQYPNLRWKDRGPVGMRDLGGCFSRYHSYDTIDHKGRVFHFFQCGGKLYVTEIFFGPWLKTRTVDTGVGSDLDREAYISCCSFGEDILVIVNGEDVKDVLCILMSIEPGELRQESICFEGKWVRGWKEHWTAPYLVQLSENEVWVSFNWSNNVWIGVIEGEELIMARYPVHIPNTEGFYSRPLRLRPKRLLAIKGRAPSIDIISLEVGERLSFEKIGELIGKGRYSIATILIKRRFVVGFGGWNKDYRQDMWIFDLQTRKISLVTNQGEWHPPSQDPVLVIRKQKLYVIGGEPATSVHFLSFSALSRMIEYGGVRSAFCFCLGLPLPSSEELERRPLRHYTPHCL